MIPFPFPVRHKAPGPYPGTGVLVLAGLEILLALSAPAFSQGKRPDFSGHWVLDKTKSDFGSGPAFDAATEDIKQRGPVIAITTITKGVNGENKRSVRYTTDGAENTNLVAGHQMKTRSRWEGGSLVTVIHDTCSRILNSTEFTGCINTLHAVCYLNCAFHCPTGLPPL